MDACGKALLAVILTVIEIAHCRRLAVSLADVIKQSPHDYISIDRFDGDCPCRRIPGTCIHKAGDMRPNSDPFAGLNFISDAGIEVAAVANQEFAGFSAVPVAVDIIANSIAPRHFAFTTGDQNFQRQTFYITANL